MSIRSGSPFNIYDCTGFNGTSCPNYVPGVSIPRSGSAVAIPGATNLFNYITLPAPSATDIANGYVVLNGGNSLGVPTCTGLDHVGCTYTADGSPYVARSQFSGPGYWNLDMNLVKNFKLTERFGLQFRGEFYNILNHHNQYIVGGNLDISSLSDAHIQTDKGGQGAATDERRNIQLALRLTF